MYERVHVCMYVRIYMHKKNKVCLRERERERMCVCEWGCVCVCVYERACVHESMYICTNTNKN